MMVNDYSSYKDTVEAWLGEVPAAWEIDQIGSLYTLRNTKVSDRDYPPLSVTMKGIVPQLDSAAKTDAHDDRKLVCIGDFAINSRSDRRGSCGISAYDGSVSLINTVLTPRNAMNPGYYNWLFHTVQFADEFYKWGHGIVDDLWTTNWQEMKKIVVPFPPMDEQERISNYLDKRISLLDDTIGELKETLKEYAEWKSAVIFETITKGTKNDHDCKEKWNNIKFKYLLDIKSGDGLSKEEIEESGEFPVYGGGNRIGYTDKSNCDAGSILIGRVGARCGHTTLLKENAWATDNALVVKPHIMPEYLYYMLVAADLNSLNTSNAQPLITGTKVKNCSMPYTENVEEQKQLVDYLNSVVEQMDGVVAEKEKLLAELEDYKQSIIFEVVTGKRKVV